MAKDTPIVETETKSPETVETVDTVKAVETKSEAQLVRKEAARRGLVKTYMDEKKVPVTVSPFYAAYLGKTVAIAVNGIKVYVPADGRTYQINETHAGELIAKIRRIDNLIARQKRAGDVSNNFERNIGELKI